MGLWRAKPATSSAQFWDGALATVRARRACYGRVRASMGKGSVTTSEGTEATPLCTLGMKQTQKCMSGNDG